MKEVSGMAQAQTTTRFVVSRMHCPSCSMLIELNVGDLEGVTDVRAEYATGVVDVTHDLSLDIASIVSTIEDAGYRVEQG